MERRCQICGRPLRTGIKYCYTCRSLGRAQADSNSMHFNPENFTHLMKFLATILVLGFIGVLITSIVQVLWIPLAVLSIAVIGYGIYKITKVSIQGLSGNEIKAIFIAIILLGYILFVVLPMNMKNTNTIDNSKQTPNTITKDGEPKTAIIVGCWVVPVGNASNVNLNFNNDGTFNGRLGSILISNGTWIKINETEFNLHPNVIDELETYNLRYMNNTYNTPSKIVQGGIIIEVNSTLGYLLTPC